jgi:hypothetical protein
MTTILSFQKIDKEIFRGESEDFYSREFEFEFSNSNFQFKVIDLRKNYLSNIFKNNEIKNRDEVFNKLNISLKNENYYLLNQNNDFIIKYVKYNNRYLLLYVDENQPSIYSIHLIGVIELAYI